MDSAAPLDRATLGKRVHDVSTYINMHAGGLELSSVSDDGAVEVLFTGMCTGCPYRPVTMEATVRPALMEIPGVTSVSAVGSRISAQAERRVAEDFKGHRTGIPIWPTGGKTA
ncbi:NifU family protein [Streptomyces sp. NPDC051217]|uniref:NifU family protein n=1 Tax=Streptomyces sp. NPDC051217 TaxID=3365644 RepID=UPI003790A61A